MRRHQGTAQPSGSQGRPYDGSSQEDQRPSKLQRLEEALDDTENNLLSAEERIQELEQALQEARDKNTQLRAGEAGAEDENNEQGETAEEPEDVSTYSKEEGEAVRTAGRRCCLLYMLWMHDDCSFDTDVRNSFETIISNLETLRANKDKENDGNENDNGGGDGDNDEGDGNDQENDSNKGSDEGEDEDEEEGGGKGKGIENGAGNGDEEDEEDEDVVDVVEEFWRDPPVRIGSAVDVVREVVSHLDTGLARQWFEPWFMRQFKLGMRKMRSEAVNEVADQYHLVFQLTENEFGERHGSKKRGEAAKKLLEHDAYLTEPLKDDKDTRSENERFLRSPTLLRATKLLLAGPSSIRNGGQRSAQAGPSRANKWHIKAITPSILSFVCTIVHFVLSGDLSFDRVTTTDNYLKMYTDNFDIIRVFRRKNRRLYDELVELYNHEILPGLHPKDEDKGNLAGMTSGRRAIFQRLVVQSSDEEEDESQEAGEDPGQELEGQDEA